MADQPPPYAPHRARLATPIGVVELLGDDRALHRVTIIPDDSEPTSIDAPRGSPVAMAVDQLEEYFDGRRRVFDVPLAPIPSPRGAVLRRAITSVGYGETQSYGAVARRFDSAARAMGQACARNPFPIIVPCHRVTSAGGAKENYSGGAGIVTKAWLNAHEAQHRESAP